MSCGQKIISRVSRHPSEQRRTLGKLAAARNVQAVRRIHLAPRRFLPAERLARPTPECKKVSPGEQNFRYIKDSGTIPDTFEPALTGNFRNDKAISSLGIAWHLCISGQTSQSAGNISSGRLAMQSSDRHLRIPRPQGLYHPRTSTTPAAWVGRQHSRRKEP